MPANPTSSAKPEQRREATDKTRERARRLLQEADEAIAESRRTLEPLISRPWPPSAPDREEVRIAPGEAKA